jgi:hypothetical protein
MDKVRNKVADAFRPMPFYFITTTEPSALSREAVFASMEKLKEAGFGGCVVFNKPPYGFSQEEYLEGKWFELLGHFAEAGIKFGLHMWINDGFDFPPGDAGGRVQKIDPSLKQRMFARDASGKIEIREVDWGFPAFEEPESSELFIKLVYEKHKKHLGKYFGNGITGFFSDADCRRFGPVAGKELQNRTEYYPCSKNFLKLFKDKYGYDLDMEYIMSGGGGQKGEDYWSLSGELYAQWFKNNHEWCQRNGLKYTFHSSDSSPFMLKDCRRTSIFTEGSYLRLAQHNDYPGTDHELLSLDGGKHIMSKFFVPSATWGGSADLVGDTAFYDASKDIRAKYASSAAFLQGKDKAMCESFAATNWGVDFAGLKQIAAWQIMQGINFFVPHAVHHRLHDELKYFAPPDFSEYGILSHGIREFNDWLSETCALASKGTLVAPVALLDPTRALWRGEADTRAFFEACDHLNHMPYGYVIADEESILKRPGLFNILVNPSLPLSKELVRAFESTGGVIISHDGIDTLPEFLGSDIAFEGSGKLQYMRRRLDSGEEMLLAANIDNKAVAEGKLKFKGAEKTVRLHPGEITVVYDKPEVFPVQGKTGRIMNLPDVYDVVWEKDNVLPMSRWEDAEGRVKTVDSACERLFFRWENNEPIEVPNLLVPKGVFEKGSLILIDGTGVGEGDETALFNDNYLKFRLGKAMNAGKHIIEFRPGKTASPNVLNNIYLGGNFSVFLDGPEDQDILLTEYYSMRLFLPSKVKVTLGNRMKKLKATSWAEQGHPFYSGALTYHASIKLPKGFSGAKLVLPEVHSVCSVKFNGIDLSKRICQPYEFEIPQAEGRCDLEMTVWNTLANMLEGYRAPSGIASRPYMILNNNKGNL